MYIVLYSIICYICTYDIYIYIYIINHNDNSNTNDDNTNNNSNSNVCYIGKLATVPFESLT